MIVIDVGCAKYGGDESIPYLIEEFHPDKLIGLDPGIERFRIYHHGGTYVVELPFAAWTHDGTVGFTVAGLRGGIDPGGRHVVCVDLAVLIEEAAKDGEVILKMDAEGSEYELLPYLIGRGADRLLKLAWVEWHCRTCGRGGGKEINHLEHTPCDLVRSEAEVVELENRMRCEMHRWNR